MSNVVDLFPDRADESEPQEPLVIHVVVPPPPPTSLGLIAVQIIIGALVGATITIAFLNAIVG